MFSCAPDTSILLWSAFYMRNHLSGKPSIHSFIRLSENMNIFLFFPLLFSFPDPCVHLSSVLEISEPPAMAGWYTAWFLPWFACNIQNAALPSKRNGCSPELHMLFVKGLVAGKEGTGEGLSKLQQTLSMSAKATAAWPTLQGCCAHKTMYTTLSSLENNRGKSNHYKKALTAMVSAKK